MYSLCSLLTYSLYFISLIKLLCYKCFNYMSNKMIPYHTIGTTFLCFPNFVIYISTAGCNDCYFLPGLDSRTPVMKALLEVAVVFSVE